MSSVARVVRGAISACLVTAMATGVATAAAAEIPVQVTQRDLVARCFNGSGVDEKTRKWDVAPGPVTLAFSMRGQERPGRTLPDPGTAEITFTAEAGHRYDVEVRADANAFSTRAWSANQWLPVVRDRTSDRIVSDAVRWVGAACATR